MAPHGLQDLMVAKPDAYPHIAKLLSGTRHASQMDVIQFFNHKTRDIILDVTVSDLPTRLDAAASATLFIVDHVDVDFIDFLLKEHQVVQTTPILQLLEDYLNARPWYNFKEVGPHLPELVSNCTDSQPETFGFIGPREFETPFLPDDDRIHPVDGTWPEGRIAGAMHPIKRTDHRETTTFLPLALVRSHFSVWFDVEKDKPWRTGVILVDPLFRPRGLPGLKGANYRAFSNRDERSSYRASLSSCIGGNPAFDAPGAPAPFVLLKDAYRIIVSEWNTTTTYFARDLNTIEWALEGREGNNPTTPEKSEELLKKLFLIRRRITRYRDLVEQQLSSCRAFGRPLFARQDPRNPDPSPDAVKVSSDLQSDFGQALRVMDQNVERVDHSITLLTSLIEVLNSQLGIKDNERMTSQNKLLMALTLVATFFLPINAVSAIVNMQDDWAPLEPKFWIFWAIAIPISVSLVVVLWVFLKPASRGSRSSQGGREVLWDERIV